MARLVIDATGFQAALVRGLPPELGIEFVSLGVSRLPSPVFAASRLGSIPPKRDPYLFEAWFNLGTIHYREGDNERAIEYLLRARNLRPENAEVHIVLGNSYKALGDVREALKAFRKALRFMPPEDDRKVMMEYLVRDLERRFPD